MHPRLQFEFPSQASELTKLSHIFVVKIWFFSSYQTTGTLDIALENYFRCK